MLLMLPFAVALAVEEAGEDTYDVAVAEAEEAGEDSAAMAVAEAGEADAQPSLVLKPLDGNSCRVPTAAPSHTAAAAGKYQFFKSVPVEKPYKFLDDQTWVGLPLIAAGVIVRSQKTYFRQNHTDEDPYRVKNRLLTSFHSSIDNYTQFAPLALAVGLKLAGVDGRSDWGRFLASGAMGYAIMAVIVNPLKYTIKEMRPDGSSANSFPSGHTATAFVGATILHKEYGLTHSPWYSIGGYAVATATGVMRVLNNRHWVSDVLAGAGIGILSTELAYGICDVIFKGKGLRRTDLVSDDNVVTKPTFFSIDMGVGFGNKNLVFNDMKIDGETVSMPFRFKPATVVGAEGAYFFNKYIGVGGRLRVRSTPVEGFGDVVDAATADIAELVKLQREAGIDYLFDKERCNVTIESDHFSEFIASFGAYANIPLSRRFALGTKALVGRNIITDIDLDMTMAGTQALHAPDYDAEKNPSFVRGADYNVKWDMVNVGANNSWTFGTGLSLTYAYKDNFSWRVFLDYDYTRKTFALDFNPDYFLPYMAPDDFGPRDVEEGRVRASTTKSLHRFTAGGAFCISF